MHGEARVQSIANALESASLSEAQRSSLSVLGGPRNGTSVVIDDVDEVLIGSDADCKLCIDLPGVSPIHARLWRDLGGARVYDTHSPSGVYVNDDRVSGEMPVKDGDILWLGAPGSPDSVMVQLRLFEPAPPGFEGAVFLVDDDAPAAAEAEPSPAEPAPIPVVAAEEFVFEPEMPGGPPPAPSAPEPIVIEEPEVIAAPEGAFVFEPPPPPEPLVEEFLVDDVPAPAPPPPPVAAPKPAPPPAPPRPAPAAAPKAPAAAPTPVPKPAAPAPPPPAKPAATPAPGKGEVFVVDDVAVAAATPPLAPKPAAAAKPAPPAPKPVAPPAEPRPVAAPRPPPAPRPAAPAAKGGGAARYLPIALGALVVLGGGGFAAMRFLAAPVLEGLSPTRVRSGDSITVRGKNFSAAPAENAVSFSGKPGRVISASATELKVEVPVVATSPGRDVSLEVKLAVNGRETQAVPLAVFQAPRIHALAPNIGMPGDDVSLAGTAWGPGAKVLFDQAPAEVVEMSASSMKVRVPSLEVAPGAEVKVTVSMGADPSNTVAFVVGRLPLVKGMSPASAAPGDVLVISGLGFSEGAGNEVRIGGARALIASASASELRVALPFLGAVGPTPVEIRVAGSENVGQTSVVVSGPGAGDPLELRFAAEPVDGDAAQAAVTTPLGPAFLLAAAGGKSAAERAVDAARKLNDAVPAIRASRDVDYVARGFEAAPFIALAGRNEPLLTATGADAALYDQRAGGRTPVSPARLAVWWEAVARDLVKVLGRGEKPERVAALSPADARPLLDLFAAAQKAGGGLTRTVLAAAKAPQIAAVRNFALRVPASVPTPAGASAAAAAAVSGSGVPAMPTDRTWNGFEVVEGLQRVITVNVRASGGSYSYAGGVSVSLPLSSVQQKKGDLLFVLQTGGRSRHYAGKWDGSKVSGRISSDASGGGDIGSFELKPR